MIFSRPISSISAACLYSLALVQLPLLLLLLWVQAATCRSALYNTSSSRLNAKLNVHIISHTHNDPGWLHSYAQYHRPLELNGRVIGGVEAILETVTYSLVDNPDRTFVYADLAFFVKWWQELHEDTKAVVRRLVQQGQLEFAGGGIVQHDEATSHYSGMVDQMSLGMRFLQQEFGRTPTVAWQLDGFGHSCTEPLLKSMGGFHALFFARSDGADLLQRKMNHSLEFVWRGSEAYSTETDMFVSQYPTGNYGPPTMDWFFEQGAYDKLLADAIQDDPETGSFNMDEAVDVFVQKAKEWQQYVQGDDVYFLMGHDFTHTEARMWFSNIDKLIHYVNKDGRVNALYSTPARYVAAKLSTPGLQLPLKTDDFFPYSSSSAGDEYWTGFYTSRPTLKTQVRRGWALLRATHQLEVLAQLQPSSRQLATSRGLEYHHPHDMSETAHLGIRLAPDHDAAALEFALATSLHHDAITGTQKQRVTHDYEQWLHVGMVKAVPKFLEGLQQLVFPRQAGSTSGIGGPLAAPLHHPASMGSAAGRKLALEGEFDLQSYLDTQDTSETPLPNRPPLLSMCLNLNSSLCSSSVSLSAYSGFLLVVYNPLSWEYVQGIRVPVATGKYAITDPHGNPVQSQLLQLSRAAELAWSSSKEAQEDGSKPTAELALLVSAPAFGHAVYKVVRVQDHATDSAGTAFSFKQMPQQHVSAATAFEKVSQSASLTLTNNKLKVEAGPEGVRSVEANGHQMLYSSHLIKYQGSHKGAGAYIFTAQEQPQMPAPTEVVITKGPVLQEVQQYYQDLGVLTTRMWAGQPYLEVEWTVGPPPSVRTGWEVFVRYNSSIASDGVWFTDANGREYQQRKRQYRPSFRLPSGAAELAGNIFPITTGCRIQDAQLQMRIAVDHAHGVVSPTDGQLDIHLHRTTAGDDRKGMAEPLFDHHVAGGTHVVSFGAANLPDAAAAHHVWRHFEQVLNDPLQLAFSATSNTKYQPTSGGGNSAERLPLNVHVLTAKWLSCSVVLLRLSHMFQEGEHPHWSRPASVHLPAVFRLLQLNVTGVQEATMFGERPLTVKDNRRPQFNISQLLTDWKPPLLLPLSSVRFTETRLVGPIQSTMHIQLNPMQIRAFYLTVARIDTCIDNPTTEKRDVATSHQAAAAPRNHVDWRQLPNNELVHFTGIGVSRSMLVLLLVFNGVAASIASCVLAANLYLRKGAFAAAKHSHAAKPGYQVPKRWV